jgi:hypothetical protein
MRDSPEFIWRDEEEKVPGNVNRVAGLVHRL